MSSQTLERFTSTPLSQAESWANLSSEDLRRLSATAVRDRDVEQLWGLTKAYLFLHGAKGARASHHTLRAYRRGVLDLLEAWQHENLLRPSRDAGVLYIRSLEATPLALSGKPAEPATLQVKLAAARAFYKALRWAGVTNAKPFENVSVAKDPTPAWEKRKPYSQREVERLLELAEPALCVMVLLGAHAGLRIGEMTELCWEDVDWNNQLILVRSGKGGKAGRVRMSGRLQASLRELRSLPDKRYGKRRVRSFVLPWGQGHARKRFRELCAQAGIAYEVKGVHGLRHGAGSRYYAQVKDLGRVAAHLRHSDIQTTRIYAKIDEMAIGEDIDDW